MDRLKILLIDDEEDFRTTTAAIIKGWGYDLIEAANGKEAIGILMGQKPDIIILDYMMPEMDGIDTLREIRKIDKDIPVVMFTAYPDMKSIKGADELRVSCYTPKLSKDSDNQASLKSAIEMVANQIKKKG